MRTVDTIFPFGKAPFWLLVLSLTAGGILLSLTGRGREDQYDLTFALFAKTHFESYEKVLPEFERKHNCRVQMQLIPARGLQSRLQSALLAGADVPDVVEILNGSIGYFTRGPLEDVGFVDLTERLHKEGIYDRMVSSRFSLWSSRGHIFAMPHDCHPVMLAYRRDLCEQLRIDVDELSTWDEFVRIGRRVTQDLDGDGVLDRYMIDMPTDGGYALDLLLLQRGGGLFDAKGRVTFDSDLAESMVLWYVRQTRGPRRIAFSAGWGQTLAKAMMDGLVLFYFCPDWRTRFFMDESPKLAGKMALMPLPAWEPGGRRASVWGGTGLAITKQCRNQKLAWEFAKFLYLDPEELGDRFSVTNIIPPVRDAWDLPVFHKPNPYYSGQPIGALLAAVAPHTPPEYQTAYTELARMKMRESFLNAASYFEEHGEVGLTEFVHAELHRNADYVRRVMSRNAFLASTAGARP